MTKFDQILYTLKDMILLFIFVLWFCFKIIINSLRHAWSDE